MNKKDAAIIKVLSDINGEPEPLTSEEEEILTRALNPDVDFHHAVQQLYNTER